MKPCAITHALPCLLLAFVVLDISADRTWARQTQPAQPELAAENEQLARRVLELEDELEVAQVKNRQLQDRIAQLEQQLEAMKRTATRPAGRATTRPAQLPEPPEVVTVDESIPTASPRALFKALMASYEEATLGLDMGEVDEPERRAYLKELESWRSNVERRFRGPIVWHVRAEDSRPAEERGERIVTMVAVDPKTDVKLGNTFDVHLSRTLTDRLARLEEQGELGVLVMKAYLEPDVRINPERETKGTFDNPPFIGPFTEFDFRLQVKSLLPPEDPLAPTATRPATPKP